MTIREKLQSLFKEYPELVLQQKKAYLTYLNKYHGLASSVLKEDNKWGAYEAMEKIITDPLTPSAETVCREMRRIIYGS